MSYLNENTIRERLSHINDPLTNQDIISAGLVSSIIIRDGHIGIMLHVERADYAARSPLQQEIINALMRLQGVEKVTPVMTAEGLGDSTSAPAQPSAQPRAKAQWNLTPIDNVKRVIAVASGKGGVGKSTVTILLAQHFRHQGLLVGIVDADIYGPSIPHMLGLDKAGKPVLSDGKMLPFTAKGDIQAMSVGFLLEAGEAAIMRGPMVTKTLHQLLRLTRWGEAGTPLDVLLVDMPPGTGDVHLSMVQQVPLASGGGGAVIVTTPQEIALLDARKAIHMFEKVQTPILGVVENMSWLEQQGGSTRLYPFGKGGGISLAQEAGVPLLVQIPLMPELGQAADAGILGKNSNNNISFNLE